MSSIRFGDRIWFKHPKEGTIFGTTLYQEEIKPGLWTLVCALRDIFDLDGNSCIEMAREHANPLFYIPLKNKSINGIFDPIPGMFELDLSVPTLPKPKA